MCIYLALCCLALGLCTIHGCNANLESGVSWNGSVGAPYMVKTINVIFLSGLGIVVLLLLHVGP